VVERDRRGRQLLAQFHEQAAGAVPAGWLPVVVLPGQVGVHLGGQHVVVLAEHAGDVLD
jgi:hypothetical protein